MQTWCSLWDFLFADKEIVNTDDMALPIFSSLFLAQLSAFLCLICFATLKQSLKNHPSISMAYFFNPNEYAALKWVSIHGAALHNVCPKRGNISPCIWKRVKLGGINVLFQTIREKVGETWVTEIWGSSFKIWAGRALEPKKNKEALSDILESVAPPLRTVRGQCYKGIPFCSWWWWTNAF